MVFDSSSKEIAWIDMKLYLEGKKIAKITNVKYAKKKAKEALHAEGDEPHSIQSGNVDYTGEVEVYKSAIDQMNDAAQAAGFNDITDLSDLTIVVEYKAGKNRSLRMDTLTGVEFTEVERGLAQGDKSMKVKLPFLFLGLVNA
jgi:hypothetical protein